MKLEDCLSDLVTRARRYRLSQAEQTRLEEHLSICASCRLKQQIGADFDIVGGLRPGDDVLIAHLADKAVQRLQRPHQKTAPRARRRSVGIAAAVACALFAAAAGAGVLAHHRSLASLQGSTPKPTLAQPSACDHSEQPDCPVPRVTVSQAPARESPEDGRAGAIADRSPSLSAVHPIRPSQRSMHTTVPAPAGAQVEASAAVETAPSLFARANDERRHNQVGAAISLYGELQRRYPGSEEARISHVSLGRLLLDRGIWSEGLSQLEDYLVTSSDGMLAPEALFGKARALETMGRRDDARAAWNRLLAKFPDSVYALQARHHIEELR